MVRVHLCTAVPMADVLDYHSSSEWLEGLVTRDYPSAGMERFEPEQSAPGSEPDGRVTRDRRLDTGIVFI